MSYKSEISSSIVIDKKTGKVKLEELEINVDGYKNRKKLRKAKEAYNSDKEIKKEHKGDDWPLGIWYYVFGDYSDRLEKWKKRVSKKK